MKCDKYRYRFMENDIDIKGEEHTLIALAKALREAEVEGTLSDLAYQIEYEFDIDGVRSEDEEYDEDDEDDDGCKDYEPSSSNGDFSPGNPWDAPGCSIGMFIR